MIEIKPWTDKAVAALKQAFAGRIVCIGLQGSYRRGEATDSSDIDLVTILDQVSIVDLDGYRRVIHSLPHGDMACGFIGGRGQLLHWPKYDLFQLCCDTLPLFGSLDAFSSLISKADIRAAVHIGAANLYHTACHSYLYADDPEAALHGLYKSAFFVLKALYYLRTGRYPHTAQALFPLLELREQRILHGYMQRGKNIPCRLAPIPQQYEELIDWSANTLNNIDPSHCDF